MITFRPLKDSDAGLLLIWMSSPHVQPFWTEDGSTPEDEVEQAMDLMGSDEGAPYIIELNKHPIGYIQSWVCGPDQPEGTQGIDLFIGDASLTGEGRGPQILKQFGDDLLAKGATRLVVDPASSNDRAISAFRKAGFDIDETRDGVTLMSRSPKLSA